MAKVYKVNGDTYTYKDFYWSLYECIEKFWGEGEIIEDDYEFGIFIEKQLDSVMDGIENYGEVVSYGKFDFWAEEE